MSQVVKFLQFHFWCRGRLDRLNYFLLMLVFYGVFFVVWLLIASTHGWDPELDNWNNVGQILIGIACLIWIWSGITNTIKRLHDMNRSGWWFFSPAVINIPLLAISGLISPELFFAVMIGTSIITPLVSLAYLIFGGGTEGINRFGTDPRTKSISRVMLGQE